LHLNMVRMLNLPDRLTGVSPSPAFELFRYYDGSDSSRYNAWQTTLQKRYSSGFSFTMAHTWASNTSLRDNDLQLNAVPQDNINLRADHRSSPFDGKHVFTSSFLYELPFARWTGASGRAAKLLTGVWQLSGVLTVSTGSPYNLTNSRSSYPLSRPDVAPG